MNLHHKQQEEYTTSIPTTPYFGFKAALSESNLYQGTSFFSDRPKMPSSPKLCNFMQDFESHSSIPSNIHVI